MSEFVLTRKSALNLDEPLDERWEGFSVAEIAGRDFFWLSAIRDNEEKLARGCKQAYGMGLPEQGKFTVGGEEGNEVVIAWLGASQWALRGPTGLDVKDIAKHANLTNQSDGWVGVVIQGSRTREILARLCPLDFHPDSFPTGSAARSPVEGMHCHICCRDWESSKYELFFQRSSARSFMDHLRHAARAVCGERRGDGN